MTNTHSWFNKEPFVFFTFPWRLYKSLSFEPFKKVLESERTKKKKVSDTSFVSRPGNFFFFFFFFRDHSRLLLRGQLFWFFYFSEWIQTRLHFVSFFFLNLTHSKWKYLKFLHFFLNSIQIVIAIFNAFQRPQTSVLMKRFLSPLYSGKKNWM